MAWLNVCGTGLVYSLPHVAEHNVQSLPRVEAQKEDFTTPDMQELTLLLKAWRGGDCPPLRRIPLYARMGLLAALRALEQSSWQETASPSVSQGYEDTALIIGTAHSGVVMSMDFMDSILDAEPRLSSPTAFSHAVNNMGAGLISLLLDVRGSCQTVSQFELSFAGAVQAATLLLHSGRAKRALVGAIDECDARFSRCCPDMTNTAQGAVFFCLEAVQEDSLQQKTRLRVGFGTEYVEQISPSTVLLSGSAEHSAGQCLAPYYGQSMLAQALDVYLSCKEKGDTLCLCTESYQKRTAYIEVTTCR